MQRKNECPVAQWNVILLTIWGRLVTICTTSLTFTNSAFCPHSVFMCFLWISEQTAIISLYSINGLVFITETECVYCAVRTGYLYIIEAKFHPQIFRKMRKTCTPPGNVILQVEQICCPVLFCFAVWWSVRRRRPFVPRWPFGTWSCGATGAVPPGTAGHRLKGSTEDFTRR